MDLDQLYDRQKRAAIAACEYWMTQVVSEGKTRLAPIEEGTLRGSGDTETRDPLAGTVLDVLGGGPVPDRVQVVGYFSTPYAQRQHESHTVGEYMQGNTTRPDDPVSHPRGGGAKYLEAPFKAAIPRLEPLIARAVAAVTP